MRVWSSPVSTRRPGTAAPAGVPGIPALAWLAVLAVLAIPGGAAAQPDGAGERLNRFLAETRTLRAEFRQEVFDERGQRVEEAAGTITLARPGKFRWVYREPYEQQVVGDGEQVWIYDADLDQVTVGDMETSIGAMPAMLLYPDRPVEDSFTVTAAGGQNALEWFDLAPHAEDSMFRRIRIALGPEGVRVMELADRFDQSIRIVFSDLERNVELDDDHFRFVVPEGADLFRR